MTSVDILDAMLDRGNKVMEKVREIEKLSGAQLVWKPDHRNWSISECLDHLITSNTLYYPIINKALQAVSGKDEFKDAGEEFRYSLTGNLMIRMVSPENRKKMSSPKMFLPKPSQNEPGVLNRFIKSHQELMDFMHRSKGLNLMKVRVYSPVNRVFKFNLGDCLTILISHDERHLMQVERVQQFRDFPQS